MWGPDELTYGLYYSLQKRASDICSLFSNSLFYPFPPSTHKSIMESVIICSTCLCIKTFVTLAYEQFHRNSPGNIQ